MECAPNQGPTLTSLDRQHRLEGYPGSTQVALLGMEQADDQALWDYARLNGFVIVTRAADYLDLQQFLYPFVTYIRRFSIQLGNCHPCVGIRVWGCPGVCKGTGSARCAQPSKLHFSLGTMCSAHQTQFHLPSKWRILSYRKRLLPRSERELW